jgi:hypothetical protein
MTMRTASEELLAQADLIATTKEDELIEKAILTRTQLDLCQGLMPF